MEGWIKLHRKISDSDLWKCEPFTRGQAWVDLIMLASHKKTYFYKRGIKVNLNRGDVGTSELGLSDRWKWSRSKVRKFLKELEKEQQIVQQKSKVTQVVTILNYKEYQQKRTTNDTTEGQQKDTFKNVKNVKNKYIDDENDFIEILKEYVNDYSRDILNGFYNYWSEKDGNGIMKVNKQKTWETKKRLATWKRQQEAWSNK